MPLRDAASQATSSTISGRIEPGGRPTASGEIERNAARISLGRAACGVDRLVYSRARQARRISIR